MAKAARCVLALVVAFALAIPTTALKGAADQAFAASSSSKSSSSSSSKGGSTTNWEFMALVVTLEQNGGVIYDDRDRQLDQTSIARPELCMSIDEDVSTYRIKGTGTVQLTGKVMFYDDSTGADVSEATTSYKGEWTSSDESVALIDDTSGLITPVADGECDITLTCTVNGSKETAKFHLEVSGQSEARYVSEIRLYQITASGDERIQSRIEVTQDMATAAVQFYAQVDVTDPKTGKVTTYSTKNGKLSAQAPDVGDVVWSCDDASVVGLTDAGVVDARCLEYGVSDIYCTWAAAAGAETQEEVFYLAFYDPDEEVTPGYTPTDTMTLKPYYLDPNTGERHDLEEIEITIDDIKAYTMYYQRFTMWKESGSWSTILGYGANFGSLLDGVGINVSDILYVSFQSDVGDTSEMNGTGDFFFQTRYTFPNLDSEAATRYSNPVAVAPMIAISSYSAKRDTLSGDDSFYASQMTDHARFYFLLGCTIGSNGKPVTNSKYEVYNIKAIEIELNPPKAEDDPGGGGGGGGEGGGEGGGGGQGGGEGGGSGSGDGGGTSKGSGNSPTGNGVVGSLVDNDDDAGSGGGDTDSLGGFDQADSTGDVQDSYSYKIYQVMNPNDSAIDKSVDVDNPLKTAAPWVALAVFLASGIGYYVWFRRQTAPVKSAGASNNGAVATV